LPQVVLRTGCSFRVVAGSGAHGGGHLPQVVLRTGCSFLMEARSV
jgi:hypothetical protein